ncbi:MAG: hypothetical protein LAT82_02435 [Nanoarchaeota archaeon]|nr:hypothetical protein [Nanoarchaeota archaeon]
MNKRILDKNDENNYYRASKKFKTSKFKPNVSKFNFLEHYSKHFKDSNNLLKLQKEVMRKKFVRLNSSIIKEEHLTQLFKKSYRTSLKKTNISNCYEIEKSHFSLSGSFPILSGVSYLQDYPSQIPLYSIDYSKFSTNSTLKIIDMCSSPGSKLTQLSNVIFEQIVQGNLKKEIKIEIISNEISKERFLKLVNNVQKQFSTFNKNTTIEFIQLDALNLHKIKHFKENFDIVLLDAPCSGNFLQERNWFNKRDKKGVLRNSQIQKQLLEVAKEICSKNGVIVYSTCSMEIEENEENVIYAQKNLKLVTTKIENNFMKSFAYPIQSIEILKNIENKKLIQHSIRIHSPYSKTQAFFVNVFKK